MVCWFGVYTSSKEPGWTEAECCKLTWVNKLYDYLKPKPEIVCNGHRYTEAVLYLLCTFTVSFVYTKSSISMVPPTHPHCGFAFKVKVVIGSFLIMHKLLPVHIALPSRCRCLQLGQIPLTCEADPSSLIANSMHMQSLHDLSHLEVLKHLKV